MPTKHWDSTIFDHGLKDGKLYNVLEVENGLKCYCICPECGGRLVAVNNKPESVLTAFFRHHVKDYTCDPEKYRETLVHYLAKEIIQKSGYIIIPKVNYYLSSNALSYWNSTFRNEMHMSLRDCIVRRTQKYKLVFDDILIEKRKHKA